MGVAAPRGAVACSCAGAALAIACHQLVAHQPGRRSQGPGRRGGTRRPRASERNNLSANAKKRASDLGTCFDSGRSRDARADRSNHARGTRTPALLPPTISCQAGASHHRPASGFCEHWRASATPWACSLRTLPRSYLAGYHATHGRNWPARLQRLAAPEAEAPHAERRRARAVLLDVGGLLRGAAFVFLRGWDCVHTSLLPETECWSRNETAKVRPRFESPPRHCLTLTVSNRSLHFVSATS